MLIITLSIVLNLILSNAEQFESSELLLPNGSQVSLVKTASFASNEVKEQKCEEITVPMCRNMEYNMTTMPNQFNHETQQEAAAEAHQFWALVEINCAKELRFFLCSMYTPICLPNYAQPVKACRSVCVRARLGCEKYMKKFGFDWPEHMNCDLFPEYGSSKEVCMDPIDAEEQQQRKKLTINHQLNPTEINLNKNQLIPKINKKLNQNSVQYEIRTNEIIKYEIFNQNRHTELANKVCQPPFVKINDPNDLRLNKFSTAGLKNCIQPCHSIYFKPAERQFTYYWLIIWSLLCLFSSFCTTCTYLIESNRFKYPEKPIIYLSICYLFVSIGYMIRFIVGHEQMACELDGSIKYTTMSTSNLGSMSCTLTFILTYYFGMASSVWWVIVSLTWFLAAGLKWGTEAILKYGIYFHLAAWVLPFIKTILILSMSLVDADALTGICYVGNLNSYNLRLFVILPASIYLGLGITFLIAGFVSLIRIRNLIKKQHSDLRKAHKLEKLMIRIGIFSILYTVPATCVIACQFYEQYYRQDWEKNIICKNRKLNGKMFQMEDNYGIVNEFCASRNLQNSFGDLPDFSIFMIKYFMSLIVGVTSGFWIWTGKSLQSWKKFLNKICFLKEQKEEVDENGASSSDESNFEPGCCWLTCSIFSSKKRVCRLQKDSIVYFQANDDVENNGQAFYANHNVYNNLEMAQQKLHQQNQMGYPHNPESIISLQYNQMFSNTMSTTNSSNTNQFYSNQYKVLQTNCHSNKAAAYLFDNGTINTTTTTNGSSLPSTISVLNK